MGGEGDVWPADLLPPEHAFVFFVWEQVGTGRTNVIANNSPLVAFFSLIDRSVGRSVGWSLAET